MHEILSKTGQESLHQDSNDKEVRLVNFATSKILVVKSTMFPQRNIHKYTARWRNCISQLFNVRRVKDVGRAEIHTAEPLVPEPSASEVELAIDKLKKSQIARY